MLNILWLRRISLLHLVLHYIDQKLCCQALYHYNVFILSRKYVPAGIKDNYPMDNCNQTSKVSMIPFLILIKIWRFNRLSGKFQIISKNKKKKFQQIPIAQSKYFQRTGGGPEKQKRFSDNLWKPLCLLGDPTGNRTPVSGVRDPRNRLKKSQYIFLNTQAIHSVSK